MKTMTSSALQSALGLLLLGAPILRGSVFTQQSFTEDVFQFTWRFRWDGNVPEVDAPWYLIAQRDAADCLPDPCWVGFKGAPSVPMPATQPLHTTESHLSGNSILLLSNWPNSSEPTTRQGS